MKFERFTWLVEEVTATIGLILTCFVIVALFVVIIVKAVQEFIL